MSHAHGQVRFSLPESGASAASRETRDGRRNEIATLEFRAIPGECIIQSFTVGEIPGSSLKKADLDTDIMNAKIEKFNTKVRTPNTHLFKVFERGALRSGLDHSVSRARFEVRRVCDYFHYASPKEHVEVPRNGGLMSSSHTCGRRVADDSGVYGAAGSTSWRRIHELFARPWTTPTTLT